MGRKSLRRRAALPIHEAKSRRTQTLGQGKESIMASTTLKVLLTLYIVYALLKFFEFFYRNEETKRKGLYTVYVKGGGKVVHIFDNAILVFTLILIALLFASGVEYLS